MLGDSRVAGGGCWRSAVEHKNVGVDDMTLLSFLDNTHIQENLEMRFKNNTIYCYIGDVLVSINPYQTIPGLYGVPAMSSHFAGRDLIQSPPHVYAIAERAFSRLLSHNVNQCIIISGESGSGKTEAAKHILQYLVAAVAGDSTQLHDSGRRGSDISSCILSTNPLLESFGNATTVRNDNSSRFGKYLELIFDGSRPVGATTTNYLLEKSRVVGPAKGERNFHIFYQLCAGVCESEREQLYLYSAQDYAYTSPSTSYLSSTDDAAAFQETRKAMLDVGISGDAQMQVFRVLSALLWMGNIGFLDDDSGHAFVAHDDVLNLVSFLLEVDMEDLRRSLTLRYLQTPGSQRSRSQYWIPRNSVQACAARDSLAKAIYERLFDYMVGRANLASRSLDVGQDLRTIGILDIYGFEIFERNSFEQLCINYVNEKLQQIFIELTLKSEQEEYVRENIQWTTVQYFDNKVVCDLIEARKPPGIMSVLNDVVATAHAEYDAADRSLDQRLAVCKSNSHFQSRGNGFCIKHYAGSVMYETAGMSEKNKDQLSSEILSTVRSSSFELVKSLFEENGISEKSKKIPTASDKIVQSASSLTRALLSTEPSYVRCIKPNDAKKPGFVDQDRLLQQIRYLDLLANIKVRRSGFCSRLPYTDFLNRYFLLSRITGYAGKFVFNGDARQGCGIILKESFISEDEFQFGSSKIFIRSPETLWLLEQLKKKYWHHMASRIQRCYRSHVRKRSAYAQKIQDAWHFHRSKRDRVMDKEKGNGIYAYGKQRRKFSVSRCRYFFGDYLQVGNDHALLKELKEKGNSIKFSCSVTSLHHRFMRSASEVSRILVVSSDFVSLVSYGREGYKLEQRISISLLCGMITSPFCDSWIVIQCLESGRDIVVNCPFKTELAVCIQRVRKGDVVVHVSSKLSYSGPGGKMQSILFKPNQKLVEASKFCGTYIRVGRGLPPETTAKKTSPVRSSSKSIRTNGSKSKSIYSSSMKSLKSVRSIPDILCPPSDKISPPNIPVPRKVPFRKQSNPNPVRYRAIHPYEAQRSDELNFDVDDVFQLVGTEGGWYKVRVLLSQATSLGQEGLIPGNYVEELPPSIPPSPPRTPFELEEGLIPPPFMQSPAEAERDRLARDLAEKLKFKTDANRSADPLKETVLKTRPQHAPPPIPKAAPLVPGIPPPVSVVKPNRR